MTTANEAKGAAMKPKTAIVERHRYVLDWFEIDKMELLLVDHTYKFCYRFGGDWYLEAKRYDRDAEKWVDVYWHGGDGFRLSHAPAALNALKNHVTQFSCVANGIAFEVALAKLLAAAEIEKGN